MVLPSLMMGMTEKERKDYEKLRDEKYHEYLTHIENEILEETRKEKAILTETYPSLTNTLKFSTDKTRLWERRKYDEDFLSVRLGSGEIPMIAEKVYQPKKFELEVDELLDEMYKVAEKPSTLTDVPIMMNLKSDFVTSLVGDHSRAIRLVGNLIAQLALTHAYDEIKVMVLCSAEEAEELSFVKYLPHNWNNEYDTRFFATSKADAQQLSKYLNNEFDGVFDDDNANKKKEALKNKPSYIVFALNKELYESIGLLKDAVQCSEYSGISVITAFEGSPKECSKLISLWQGNRLIDLKQAGVDDLLFILDVAEKEVLEASMRNVMKTKLRLDMDSQFALPTMLTFLELYRAGKVEYLNPLRKWKDNNPVKSLAAPIGVDVDGNVFTLDLHEKRQGPHGLIAGGTGSGKSEFIITYILSMAVSYSPDEVAFILIDYKGGGLADAFVDPKRGIHLPHVVGTITNLDGAAINRSLMSINSELKRRQSVFKKAKSETNEGTMDIYDYQRLYRNKKVSEPMPHLFIISDEFAELKKQQPEFMDELISTARIGRSLGVHLILATQKPSGVVNDQIWSNTKFRVCLKVADKGDSMEMLKRPEAAEIKNTGRFYLQVGYNDFFAMGQSAWCGADYIPQDEVVVQEDDSVQFVDNVGQIVLNARRKQEVAQKSGEKQIVSIVKYLSDLSKRENIVPRSLWCEPLPMSIDYEKLEQEHPIDENGITALIGMVDSPETQSQFPYMLDMLSFHHMLLCGGSGTGKSNIIRTMLYSLISRYSADDVNYYILDMSGGALIGFAKGPHCGAYLTENNEADFDRLLSLIKEVVTERKKLFADSGVTNFESYRQTGNKLPLILLVFDNYTNINNFRRGSMYYTNMCDYMKECSAYGIRFVISCNHLNEVHSKTRQEIDYRIALQCKDRYEYSDVLDLRCNIATVQTKGRGACIVNEKVYEFHAAMVDAELSVQEQTAKLKERVGAFTEKYGNSTYIRELPIAEGNEKYEVFCNRFTDGRIPLGYSLKEMKPVGVPLHQLHSMSLYFGNNRGIKPVFSNLIHACILNKIDLIIVKKAFDSIFETEEIIDLVQSHPGKASACNSSEEGLEKLKDWFMQELAARNVFRDKYCEENNIPSTLKDRVRKAEKYIRANTTPVLIIFESLGDICRLERTETIQALEATYQVFFERTKGYNIYFAAGFYPEDKDVTASLFKQSYNKEQFSLLFGGRYDKQIVVDSLPMEFRAMDKPNPKYDRFLFKYRDELFQMRMPCGELVEEEIDPDEASII